MSDWLRRERVLIRSVQDAEFPSPADLDLLAKRIWEEVEGKAALPWASIPHGGPAYRRIMRLALAALGVALS